MASFTSLKLSIANIPIYQQHSAYRSNADSLILTTSFITPPKSLNLHSRKGLTLQRHSPRPTLVASAQSNFLRVLQTVWKVGKDGIEAGTDFVPASIPRPIARIGVAGVLLSVSLFVLKSFLSTAFFVMGVMGLIYFLYIAMNKDEGPRGGGGGGGGGDSTSEDIALEEARRIMEKYK